MFKCSKYSKCSKCCVQNKNHFSRRKRKGEIKWYSIFFSMPIFDEFNYWYIFFQCQSFMNL